MHDFSVQAKPYKTTINQDNVEMIRFLLRRNGIRGRTLLERGLDIIGLTGPEIAKYVDIHAPILGRTGELTSTEIDDFTFSIQIQSKLSSASHRVYLYHENIFNLMPSMLMGPINQAILLDLDFCRMFDTDWGTNDQAHMVLWSTLAHQKIEWVFMSVTHCARNELDLFETEEKIRDLVVPWIEIGYNPEINTVCRYKDPHSPTMINAFIALRDLHFKEKNEVEMGRDGEEALQSRETVRTEEDQTSPATAGLLR